MCELIQGDDEDNDPGDLLPAAEAEQDDIVDDRVEAQKKDQPQDIIQTVKPVEIFLCLHRVTLCTQVPDDRRQRGKEKSDRPRDHTCKQMIIAVLAQNDHADETGDDQAVDGIDQDRADLVHEHGPDIAADLLPGIRIHRFPHGQDRTVQPADHNLRHDPDHQRLDDLADQKDCV